MKIGSSSRMIIRSWQVTAFGIVCCSILQANPIDPTVVSGTAQIQQIDAKTMHIQTSDTAVINWKDFSIAQGELTQFFQPGKGSIVVNKVTSDISSTLLGGLKANGQVFLLNPNGILVGESGSIDTNGFMASTLSVSPEALMSGKSEILFSGDSKAAVINLGTINAWDGDVVLIGYQVDNAGKIFVPNGTAVLGAGQEIILQPQGKDRISIRLTSQKTPDADTGILNTGLISACEAELKAGGNAYGMAIKHTGVIDATGIVNRNGRVMLVAENGNNGVWGNISAKNQDGSFGGQVQVLGEHVALVGTASIDVSGTQGGGNVNIGGGRSGQDASILNAQTTFVDKEAVIFARATDVGNGGDVILWSDGATYFHGQINSRGGEKSGNGGFVEVSGHRYLDFQGIADRLAVNGTSGTLLLDPINITLIDPVPQQITPSPVFGPDATGCASQVTTTNILVNLAVGPIIVESSGALGPGPCNQPGSVIINSPLVIPSTITNSLTFRTKNTTVPGVTIGDIQLNQPLTNNGTGALNFNSVQDVLFAATVASNGAVTVTADRDVFLQNNGIINMVDASLAITAGRDFGILGIKGSISIKNNPGVTQPFDGTIIAGRNFFVAKGTGIVNSTSGGALTLVCDNNFPTPPNQGPGQFVNQDRISTLNGPLRVFTSRRSQNVPGILNIPFAPGPFGVNTATEQWGVWYPSSFGGTPYTVFYKESSSTPNNPPGGGPTPHQLQQAYNLFNIAAYEFFQRNKDFDSFFYWETLFTSDYDREAFAELHSHQIGYRRLHPYQSLMSSDVFDKSTYGLLRKSYKESNGKITNLLR